MDVSVESLMARKYKQTKYKKQVENISSYDINI